MSSGSSTSRDDEDAGGEVKGESSSDCSSNRSSSEPLASGSLVSSLLPVLGLLIGLRPFTRPSFSRITSSISRRAQLSR